MRTSQGTGCILVSRLHPGSAPVRSDREQPTNLAGIARNQGCNLVKTPGPGSPPARPFEAPARKTPSGAAGRARKQSSPAPPESQTRRGPTTHCTPLTLLCALPRADRRGQPRRLRPHAAPRLPAGGDCRITRGLQLPRDRDRLAAMVRCRRERLQRRRPAGAGGRRRGAAIG